uniref:Tim44-like domain-containing protein n=1 Tax=Chromera velia CCMP2878 TaxID=1169474 RepID=A0A0G4F187_9ALVE|eukprot:Cvel_14685.t1-p1 / transcript=Cvel_14685.t1 / gene=Cvel_14685 / organism=Chromera_velia_CCMP2878 / gene_product=Mitochondrial import inner membrane translocase, putative / transcript_product=Mitochondrial import inner membrane translocase, putative / location=Cvel_scaffold1053:52840-58184(+) / protein_length=388 / sequence_SO=supercontig / SO=protein_coding / is_pseudo=false
MLPSRHIVAASRAALRSLSRDTRTETVRAVGALSARQRPGSSSSRDAQRETRGRPQWVQSRRMSGGFFKNVMDQVKKDLETNEGLRKAYQDLEKSGADKKLGSFSQRLEENAEQLKAGASATGKTLSDFAEKVKEAAAEVGGRVDKTVESSEALKSARDAAMAGGRVVGGAVGAAFSRMQQVADAFRDNEGLQKAQQKTAQWREKMAQRREEDTSSSSSSSSSASPSGEEAGEAAGEGEGKKEKTKEEVQEENLEETAAGGEYAVVLHHDSAWDRFGSRLRDMPFLHSFFENPVFGKFFGETELAVAIKEQKKIDPSFRLADFAEEVEHVIAPKLVSAFLEGDADFIKLHCGEIAYATCFASIRERQAQRLTLDPNILLMRNVQLKGE